jgi:hypothetical protein
MLHLDYHQPPWMRGVAAALNEELADHQARTFRKAGVQAGGARVWACACSGDPFAAPRVGKLRWKPPRPVTSWGGVRNADRFGPRAMQLAPTRRSCQYSSYLQGGGNVAGDGSEPRYDRRSTCTPRPGCPDGDLPPERLRVSVPCRPTFCDWTPVQLSMAG